MKTMTKKLLSLLLVFVMALGMFPAAAQAETLDEEAIAEPGQYNVIVPAGYCTIHGDPTATGGQDYVFSVELGEFYQKGSDYAVVVNGEELTANADGSYTVPAVSGELVIDVQGVEPMDVNPVTVTFSVTRGVDEFYMAETTSTILAPTEITVPYFDLGLYGLERYYYNPDCYANHKETDTEDNNSQTPGTVESAYGVITNMHALIYATEVFYLGIDPADAGKGLTMEGGAFEDAVSWTGHAGSSYMNFWDHGTNLNYYLDWEYPLGAENWGSTSDQQRLYDGMEISVHLIESKSATGSDFAFFTADGTVDVNSQADEVTVNLGSSITLTAVRTRPDWKGFATTYGPYTDKALYWVEEENLSGELAEWNSGVMGNEAAVTDANGQITIDTSELETGSYYIATMGIDDHEVSTEMGPAIIKLTIVCEHDWEDPTCTAPKTCSQCGKTMGNAAGHKWAAATCQNPQTCSACGATEGEKDPEAHVYANGSCTLCGAVDPGNVSFDSAPALTGSASASLLEVQNALYRLDLSSVFSQGAWYTVSIDGAEAVSTSKKFSYSCAVPGSHTLVFTSGNNKGDSPSYTVTLTVLDTNAVQRVNHAVQGGTIEWFAFTDADMNPLPAGTTYEWDAAASKFTVTQPADIDRSGKVMAFYKLTKDTDGAKLPLLTGSTLVTGAGTKWDGAVRDRQTVTLYNGEADAEVYLYETGASTASNQYTTIRFDFNRTKPASYFEYKTSGYATYTIAGEEGGVNGHSWITSDEVHIALKDTVPADAALSFLNQKAVTTLTDGAGSYTWGQKTIKYKIDNFPRLANGKESSATASVPAGSAYTFDLSGLFVDADKTDTLSYRVKINGSNMKKVSGSTYSYTPSTAGTYTLAFYAYDGFVYSEDCHTVTLTAVNLAETYDVTVSNLPEGAEFYYNNGFSTDGTDILGGKLDASYANKVYTVQVPGNISCIAIVMDGRRITAEVSEENNAVTMQKTSFLVNTKAGDQAEGTVSVSYGGGHTAVGKDNVFWLVSGSGYLFEVLPSEAFSDRWARGGQSGTITTAAEATITLKLEVNSPKVITIDKGAELTVFYQWGYYRMYPVEPALVVDNGSTITYTYPCPNNQAYARGYMYFATNGDLIDKAGYMNAVDKTTITWDGETRTKNHIGTNDRYTYMNDRTDDSVMVNVNPQNHLVLNPGDTFRLRAFRIWEIINTDTENVMIEPQFIYSGYDPNLISLVSANEALAAQGKNQVCGTGGNNWMDMTVKGSGTTFMEVSYEAIHIVNGFEAGDWGGAGGQPSNYLFSACDPARTSLIVIQTDGNAASDVSFGIDCLSSMVGEENFYTGTGLQTWDTEFDTFYFIGDYGQMTLSPSAASGVQSLAVSYDKGASWATLEADENGVYTVDIYSGNNLLRVINGNGQTAYQVVRGDQITYTQTITNDLNKNGEVDPGDTVKLQFHGLHNPVGKMSGIYNPGYSHGQRLAYTWNGEQVRQSSYHQYSFVTNAEISVTVPEDATGSYALTDGYIHFNVFGDAPGSHRALTDGGRPVNTTAGSSKYTRSLLPDIVIYDDGTEEEVLLGDVTGDGVTDAADALSVYKYVRGMQTPDETASAAADVNKDGVIDATDALTVYKYIRGKLTSLTAG